MTLLGAMGSAQADAKFKGATGYQVNGNTVTLTAASVYNPSAENASGTLMLKLWACDQPYKGGSLGGNLLGSYKLNGLSGGQYYSNLSKNVAYTPPAVRKSYYVVLALVEYRDKGYVVVDSRNMPNPAVLGPTKLVEMDGPYRWQTNAAAGTVAIDVGKIKHARPGKTGTLKLSVWATKTPYKGGAIQGYELGSVQKKALEKGYTYTDVKNTAKYTPPPAGTHYVSILLTEFGNNEEYTIMDYFTTATKSTFGAPQQ